MPAALPTSDGPFRRAVERCRLVAILMITVLVALVVPAVALLRPATSSARSARTHSRRTHAGGCPGADVHPTRANAGRVQAAVLCLVNSQRALARLPLLRINPMLRTAANIHGLQLVRNGDFTHAGPSGSSPLDRARAAGYRPCRGRGCLVGENLAWSVSSGATPAAIVSGWMTSADHRANILRPDFRDTGVSVIPVTPTRTRVRGATYTEDFGAPLR